MYVCDGCVVWVGDFSLPSRVGHLATAVGFAADLEHYRPSRTLLLRQGKHAALRGPSMDADMEHNTFVSGALPAGTSTSCSQPVSSAPTSAPPAIIAIPTIPNLLTRPSVADAHLPSPVASTMDDNSKGLSPSHSSELRRTVTLSGLSVQSVTTADFDRSASMYHMHDTLDAHNSEFSVRTLVEPLTKEQLVNMLCELCVGWFAFLFLF